MFGFEIRLKDRTLKFNDIFDLLDEQREIIFKYAQDKTFEELGSSNNGVKIPLEDWQQSIVLAHKNNLIENKDEKTLMKEKTIIFTKHSRQKIAVRIENLNLDDMPSPESILLIVKLVIESRKVHNSAEWKGRNNLVYTLIHEKYNEKFKISISFEKIGTEHMKIITIGNEHIDELTFKLSQIPEIFEELKYLKGKLITTDKSIK